MKKIRNVVSCFDGYSGGQMGLIGAGIEYGTYYASEIDKYAMAVTQHNHPKTVQVGDIIKWREWNIDWSEVDLVVGGSPCQGFSFAGKQLNFEDPRSALFFVFVDIVNHVKKHNPKVKFLLENVRMKKEYQEVISEYMEVEPIKDEKGKPYINSALVSAQNRVRSYWTNIENVAQPKDRGILLRDILEGGIPIDNSDKKILVNINPSGKGMNGNVHSTGRDKSPTLTTNKGEGVKIGCIQVGEADLKGHDQIKRVYSPSGKCPTLTTMGGGHREPKVVVGGAIRGRYNEDGSTSQKLEINGVEKTNAITTVQKDSLVVKIGDKLTHPEATIKGYAEAKAGEGLDLTFPKSKTRRGRSMKTKSNCLTAANYDYGIVEKNEENVLHWRKLTPLECERLQTLPDNYTNVPWLKRMMSNSQRYKMLGNGWTVDVISHIFKNL